MNRENRVFNAAHPLRVAVVGCGAVTRVSLLPVLAGHDRIQVAALVDRDRARAAELGEAYGISRIETDVARIARADIDAIVIATPPAHHAGAAIAAAEEGLHVFVEKPMAIRSSDAQAMVDAASKAGVAMSVGLYRRLLPAARLMRGLLQAGMLGRVLSVDAEEGGSYGWQLTTMAVLTREGGGGGVLIDLGTHLLDQLLYVVGGDAQMKAYRDNARGGIETDCELHLDLATAWGVIPGRVELSRTRELRGSLRVTCEHGVLELNRGEFCQLAVHAAPAAVVDDFMATERPVAISATWAGETALVGYKAFRTEFDDWLAAIEKGREPALSARSAVPVVRLIEQCYARATPLEEPWTDETRGIPAPTGPAVRATRKPRVLVTGAGGFLGTRTCELLHLSGRWDVRALVRRPGSAARLARWPFEIVVGDVTSADDVGRAVDGCDAVVHCAVGTGWPPEAVFQTTVSGTRTTAEAALRAGVRRFVHISSMAVHGDRVPPRLDESAPLTTADGIGYGPAKLLAERAVDECVHGGLRAIILRPARIYGPFSRTFITRPLEALRNGRLVLEGDADSPANMLYVDNVVEAIMCSLDSSDAATGRAFLINEPDQLSWLQFYEFFASAGGRKVSVVPFRDGTEPNRPGLLRRWADGSRAVLTSPELRGLAKRVMNTDPFGAWPRKWWEQSPRLQTRVLTRMGADPAVVYREPKAVSENILEFRIFPTLVVSEKAARDLGYEGRVARNIAMQLTLEWAKQARLI